MWGQENCWFFISVIQEALVTMFGGLYRGDGSLNHPSLSKDRRKDIMVKLQKELRHQSDEDVETLERLVLEIGDPLISTVVQELIYCLDHFRVSNFQSRCSPLHANCPDLY